MKDVNHVVCVDLKSTERFKLQVKKKVWFICEEEFSVRDLNEVLNVHCSEIYALYLCIYFYIPFR